MIPKKLHTKEGITYTTIPSYFVYRGISIIKNDGYTYKYFAY